MSDKSKNKCCMPKCGKAATWEITDTNHEDPYTASTHSCNEHIADLIGSVEPTAPTGPWMLTPM